MNSLAVFQFNTQEIRFIDGKPVANDIAKVLGYADPKSTVSRKVSNKNKGVAKIATPGGIQSITVLEEAGIYQLIFSSQLEEAEKFQDWVFTEVLPSIRKTGQYRVRPMSPAEILMQQAQLMLKLEQEQELLKQKVALESQRVDGIQELVEQHDCELERIFKPDGDYYSVRGYAKKLGVKNLTISEAKKIGKKASKYCKQEGIPMDKMDDPRYGYVNLYPERVLSVMFE
jgi:prophage antirepressor-like protein